MFLCIRSDFDFDLFYHHVSVLMSLLGFLFCICDVGDGCLGKGPPMVELVTSACESSLYILCVCLLSDM